MAFKVYKRIGIRRDNNLSDLSNPTTALNNLLDTLAPLSDESFLLKIWMQLEIYFLRD